MLMFLHPVIFIRIASEPISNAADGTADREGETLHNTQYLIHTDHERAVSINHPSFIPVFRLVVNQYVFSTDFYTFTFVHTSVEYLAFLYTQ